jgi:isoprenylcysteine carboxyl methyltransferase (ICMT) family protein YpbQ
MPSARQLSKVLRTKCTFRQWIAEAAAVNTMASGSQQTMRAISDRIGRSLEGLGTPAPIAPPQKLVATGLYRYVRNPMYVAIVSVTLGQSLLFADWHLVVYAALC